MTLEQLITMLEKARTEYGGDVPVRIYDRHGESVGKPCLCEGLSSPGGEFLFFMEEASL